MNVCVLKVKASFVIHVHVFAQRRVILLLMQDIFTCVCDVTISITDCTLTSTYINV